MNRIHLIATAAAAMVTAGATPAFASSHREAPAISNDPAADNTDLWAWVTPGTHEKLYVVASFNPLEEPSGGPNFHKFSDDVLYEIHVVRGTSLNDAITYQIRFKTTDAPRVDPASQSAPLGGGKEFFAQLAGQSQTYTVKKVVGNNTTVIAQNIPVAPVNIGPRTDAVVYGATYDDAFAATFIRNMGTTGSEGRVWAGPRDDGFYVDLGGVFDLANLRGPGVAQDGVSGFNCHTIALEIPTTTALGTASIPHNGTPGNDTLIGVWASASRKKVTILRKDGSSDSEGPWVQVSRLGLPLINEAVVGLQDKDKYNRTSPATDLANIGAYILNPVIVRDAIAVGILPGTTGDDVKYNRTDIVGVINLDNIPSAGAHSLPLASTGDVLRLDVATDSQFPNGRSIPGGATAMKEQVDVTDILVSLLLTKDPGAGLSDNVNSNDKPYLSTFPFLALPWNGYDQGHGAVPAP